MTALAERTNIMTRILMVEDDEIIRESFAELLEDEGFTVETCSDRGCAMRRLGEPLPDLAIFDITLGKDSEAGFDICAEYRKRSKTLPIIIFTSHGSDFDRISGMRLGVDDYIVKDVSLQYLVVRIKALLRRVEVLTSGEDSSEKKLVRGDLVVDMETLTAYWKGEKLDISLTQLWILNSIAGHPGQVRSPDQLMHAANIVVEPNTIAAHIKTIRQSFHAIDPDFSAIKTERGLGYRWLE